MKLSQHISFRDDVSILILLTGLFRCEGVRQSPSLQQSLQCRCSVEFSVK